MTQPAPCAGSPTDDIHRAGTPRVPPPALLPSTPAGRPPLSPLRSQLPSHAPPTRSRQPARLASPCPRLRLAGLSRPPAHRATRALRLELCDRRSGPPVADRHSASTASRHAVIRRATPQRDGRDTGDRNACSSADAAGESHRCVYGKEGTAAPRRAPRRAPRPSPPPPPLPGPVKFVCPLHAASGHIFQPPGESLDSSSRHQHCEVHMMMSCAFQAAEAAATSASQRCPASADSSTPPS